MLASAKAICGHNIIPFDIPALVKVYPWFRLHPECIVWDTLVYARLVYPHLKQIDQAAMKKWKRPADFGSLIGRSEEHTSELQSLMRISYAVFCLKKKIEPHTPMYFIICNS